MILNLEVVFRVESVQKQCYIFILNYFKIETTHMNQRKTKRFIQKGVILHIIMALNFISLNPTSLFASKRVYWDISHTPIRGYDLDDQYSDLAEMLEENDFELLQGEESVVDHGLWDIDILAVSILSNYNSSYSDDEIDRIRSFVNGGGGLIVLADDSNSRPDNIELLLDEFGLLAAQGDNLGELIQFDQHSITEGLERISMELGGIIDLAEDDNGQIIGFDFMGSGGIAINEEQAGRVILFGDADGWINEYFADEEYDNALFALNCFNSADRDAQGVIEIADEQISSFLLNGHSEEIIYTVTNSGDGLLEIGTEIDNDLGWLSVEPEYAIIEAGQETDISVTVFPVDLNIGEEYRTNLTIHNNDPDADDILVPVSLFILSDELVHFNIPQPAGQDHSLLINGITINEIDARTGLEIGVFTEDGICAGGAVYTELPTGFPAIADDPFTEEIDGFQSGETFYFRLYLPWEDLEIGTEADFERGEDNFRTDGFSVLSLNGRSFDNLVIELSNTWNIISLNVQPINLSPAYILEELLDQDNLLMVKDDRGCFWSIERGYSNLGPWNILKGYAVKVINPVQIEVEGLTLDPQQPIRVNFGWSMISFLPDQSISVVTALNTLENRIILVKDDEGSFYSPEWDWNGIGALEPGEGYQIKLRSVGELIYPLPQNDELFSVERHADFTTSPTGIDMSLLLTGFNPMDEIRVINEQGFRVGHGFAGDDGRLGIPVWGDDPFTGIREGLAEDELFSIQVFEIDDWYDAEIEWLESRNNFSVNGFSVGENISLIPVESELVVTCRPNPFNSEVTVSYRGFGGGMTVLEVYDIAGRILERRIESIQDRKWMNSATFDATTWPSGLVLVRINQGKISMVIKTLHLP